MVLAGPEPDPVHARWAGRLGDQATQQQIAADGPDQHHPGPFSDRHDKGVRIPWLVGHQPYCHVRRAVGSVAPLKLTIRRKGDAPGARRTFTGPCTALTVRLTTRASR